MISFGGINTAVLFDICQDLVDSRSRTDLTRRGSGRYTGWSEVSKSSGSRQDRFGRFEARI